MRGYRPTKPKSIHSPQKFGLHPLIHTIVLKTSAQDVEKKKAELKTPHFLRLNQDIVASPQDEKCGLKYVI